MGGLFRLVDAVVDNISFTVVKHAGRVVYGLGQTAAGFFTNSDELIEQGVKNTAKGSVGLGIGSAIKKIFGQGIESDDSQDLDIEFEVSRVSFNINF